MSHVRPTAQPLLRHCEFWHKHPFPNTPFHVTRKDTQFEFVLEPSRVHATLVGFKIGGGSLLELFSRQCRESERNQTPGQLVRSKSWSNRSFKAAAWTPMSGRSFSEACEASEFHRPNLTAKATTDNNFQGTCQIGRPLLSKCLQVPTCESQRSETQPRRKSETGILPQTQAGFVSEGNRLQGSCKS